MLEDVIHKAIESSIDCKYLEVTGDGQHFDAVVVSDSFLDKSRIDRHKMVYMALGDAMRNQVHALSMKLYTIEEWSKING